MVGHLSFCSKYAMHDHFCSLAGGQPVGFARHSNSQLAPWHLSFLLEGCRHADPAANFDNTDKEHAGCGHDTWLHGHYT